MTLYHLDDQVALYRGDALDALAGLADGAVDAVVTDPPYGLEFMGKEWDGADGFRRSLNPADAGRDSVFGRTSRTSPEYRATTLFQEWSTRWAAECLRVLKPGGHLLAFGGTRTWHRLACAIEDAGFEIRDTIAWLYGSGFPKSLDVSKAIDKTRNDRAPVHAMTSRLADLADAAGITRADVDEHMGTSDMGGWWLSRLTHRSACPSVENWARLREFIPGATELDDEVWRLNGRKGTPGEAWAQREVIGERTTGIATGRGTVAYIGDSDNRTITAPDDARRWAGWGTALKPAHEPIIVARRPLAGTVAANVTAHGTGALNIDGCRVVTTDNLNGGAYSADATDRWDGKQSWRYERGKAGAYEQPAGRWPTNVVLDGDTADELDRQSGVHEGGHSPKRRSGMGYHGGAGTTNGSDHRDADGGASRFFPVFRYQAKAPSKERPKVDGVAHPTVKPLELMRWLVRLVTPPGGIVLDPFVGSGTTAQACAAEGLRCVAIEREPTYMPLILARLGIDEATVTEEAMTTWGGLHAGDVVAGADGRAWEVVSLGGKHKWVAGAPTAEFKLRRLDDGETTVATTQRLTDPAPLQQRGDHHVEADAAAVLIAAGLNIEIIEETTVTEATVDPFMNPGTAPSQTGVQRKEAPRGQWGWYKLPAPGGNGTAVYPRVSTIAKTLCDDFGLVEWKLRMVAKGVALRKDLIAKAAALDVDTDKGSFSEVVKAAMEKAESARGANYGTAVHKFCERLDCGETIEALYQGGMPDDVVPVVRAYAAALKAARLTVVPEYCERTVVNHRHGYAGTIDKVVRAADGTLYVLDLKTGKDVAEYGGLEFGVQQALYVNAEAMCTLDFAGYEPLPPVDKTKSLILHVPFANPESAIVYALNVGAAATAAMMSLQVRELRKTSKEWLWAYSPGAPADAVRLRIGRAVSLDELGAAVNDAKRIGGAWTPEMERYALARFDVIRVSGAADRAALAALWAELHPAGRWTDDIAALAAETAQRLAVAGAVA